MAAKARCGHLSLSSLYERGPKAGGSKFILAAKKCRQCGAIFPVVKVEAKE